MRRLLHDHHQSWSVDFHPRDEQVDGLTVGLLDSRPEAAASERSFVLVHGLGVSSLYFQQLADVLAHRTRVIAVDLPGFGRTTRPERSLQIGHFATALEHVLARLGLQDATLIGHSMGTQVVVEALARHPTGVRAGVLIGPVVNPDERRGRLVVQRFLQGAARETAGSAWPSVRAFVQCGPRWFLDEFPAMVGYPIEDRIAEVEVPVAVVAGEYDRLAPRSWVELLAARAGGPSCSHVVEGASHQVMVTHPDTVAEICRRLSEAEPC